MENKYALISLSDTTNLAILLKGLSKHHYQFIATNTTAEAISKLGYHCQKVEELTNYPEFLEGRVKTLQPEIHGGILADLDNHNHVLDLEQYNLKFFSLVVCNLYPFAQALASNDEQKIIENIDIGGVTLLRSAAKNYRHVGILTDYDDYQRLLDKLDNNTYDESFRRYLAGKSFSLCAEYDYLIASYFAKKITLRYGENPHQEATYQQTNESSFSISSSKILQGKELSYNNIIDIDAAFLASYDFSQPCAIAIKHTTICGVGFGLDIHQAYLNCLQVDSKSIFGGIIIFNREVDDKLAYKLTEIFLEVIIAPSYTKKALEIFKKKKNLRIIQGDFDRRNFKYESMRSVVGGLLKQNDNNKLQLDIVDPVYKNFYKIVKHIKSNGVLIAQKDKVLGLCGGSVARIDACKFALLKAKENINYDKNNSLILVSDGFFPFNDIVDLALENNIKTIICPQGSLNDERLKQACQQADIKLIFTNLRYFKH